MARSKKGISLAFVIVVVLALMILAGMLFSAASHSLSMTGDSTDGRQAYLTAKSAIEYAKTVAFGKAKTTGLAPFSVGPDGGGYKEIADAAPDGTTAYAECANPGGDGKTWKILAKVKYKNADKYRQLAYSFTLTKNAALVNFPVSDFLACGVSYGANTVLGNSNWWPVLSSVGASSYPVVEMGPLHTSDGAQSKSLTAPEIFLLGDSGTSEGDWVAGNYSLLVNYGEAELHSDYIEIRNDIFTSSSSYTSWQNETVVSNTSVMNLYPGTQNALTGIVYFAGNHGGSCLIKRGSNGDPADAQITVPQGYYSFEAGFDLASIVADSSDSSAFLDNYGKTGAKRMKKISEDAVSPTFRADIAYLGTFSAGEGSEILSGGGWSPAGANYESGGIFAQSPAGPSRHNDDHWNVYGSGTHNLDESTVFTYANSVEWNTDPWPLYLSGDGSGEAVSSGDGRYLNTPKYALFVAKQFFLRFVGSNDFTLPGAYHVVFHSDLVSLSMAQTDTSAGGSADDRPKIVQAANAPDSQFLLTSLSKDETTGDYKNVTLAVQNAIKVVYGGGTETYTIPSGVYSVESGFNFFAAPPSQGWDAFWKGCSQGDYPASGGGSGEAGGSGGFTITPGQYTDS